MPLEALDLAILVAAALATSILSAVVGMAGGIVLLSVMLLYLEPLAAIPLHGVIQLVSNGSRAIIQRRHVDWSLAWRYAVLLLPAGAVGMPVAYAMSPPVTRSLIGVFVLAATWRPGWLLLGTHPEDSRPRLRFFALGGVTGFLQMVIGAVGPLIAPFFLNLGLTRQAMVGTKAACQVLGHMSKLILFGIAGFAYLDWAGPLAAMCGAVIAGTWLGSQLLERVNERMFTLLFKGVLTAVALRLVLWEGWKLLAPVL
jgi:uncharacterized membrane protein YfcA